MRTRSDVRARAQPMGVPLKVLPWSSFFQAEDGIRDSKVTEVQTCALPIYIRDITKVFINDNSVKKRLCGVGVLSRQEAYELGCVGPTLRASGGAQDMRQLGSAALKALPVQPITRTEGDSYARCSVRCEELFQS